LKVEEEGSIWMIATPGGGGAAFREVIPEPTIYDDGGGGGLTGIAALRWIFPENDRKRERLRFTSTEMA
jgi:hypothetical protein